MIQLNKDMITFKRQKLQKTCQSQTDHILINKKLHYSIQNKWTQFSDHTLIIINLAITDQNNKRREIIEINKTLAIQQCRKLQNQLTNFKSFYEQYSKQIMKYHIINKRRIRLRKLKLQLYEQELFDKFNQTFQGNENDFFKLIKKTILMNLNKREGGIFNCFLDDSNNIITGEEVFKNCFNQLDKYSMNDQYFPLKFPLLPLLQKDEIENLPDKLSKDKAISYDCLTHEFIKNCNWKILSDIWKEETFQVNKQLAWTRLVPLNKVYPDIPNKDQFRPIVILSPLYKLLELRFSDKLMKHLQENILKGQTGFIKGYGTQVNILALCDIFKKTKAQQNKVMIFIDFSSAQNTGIREKLYKLLETDKILNKIEIEYLKAIHSRIIYINPYKKTDIYYYKNGVLQGSPISPLLFDIYMDGSLRELQEKITFPYQFLGYADDLLFIIQKSKLKQFLQKLCNLAINWNFKINEKKSGLLPIKFKMQGEYLDKFPIVNNYKYLEIHIDRKGKIKQHIKDINQIMQYKLSKLKYISYKMDFRQRLLLFLIYLQPYFNYCLIVEQFQNKTIRKTLQQLKKQIFKDILKLLKNTNNKLMDSLLECQEQKSKKNIKQILMKTLQRQLDLSDLTKQLLEGELIISNNGKDRKQISQIYLIPNNLQYLYKFAWTYCKTHNNKRLTRKHIIIEHLKFKNEDEFYHLLKDNLNKKIQQQIEKEIDNLIVQYITIKTNFFSD